jgi:hypothetical protein
MRTDDLIDRELENLARQSPMNIEDALDHENFLELVRRGYTWDDGGRYALSIKGAQALEQVADRAPQNALLIELRNAARLRVMGSHEAASVAALVGCTRRGWLAANRKGEYSLTKNGRRVLKDADPAALRED